MVEEVSTSGWKTFWDRGGWWRALLLIVVYYGVFQAISFWVVGPLFNSVWGEPDSAEYVFFTTALPIALAGVVLVLFALSIGWLKELFGPQPIRGRGWMWIAVAVVLLFNVLRLFAVDYDAAGFGVVASWLLAGLFVGFAEEVVTRGFVVNLMRRAGHREISVALVSAALFSLLHIGNLFAPGAVLGATLLQLVYTFFFGILMYLTLRVTGNLIWPILLHASTDPTISLATAFPNGSPFVAIGGLGTIGVAVVGLVLLFFIRGQVDTDFYSTKQRTAVA